MYNRILAGFIRIEFTFVLNKDHNCGYSYYRKSSPGWKFPPKKRDDVMSIPELIPS